MQFLKDQKELEEVFIKKLFDYKLSSGKCLPTVNWSELVVTTVDTLTKVELVHRKGTRNLSQNLVDGFQTRGAALRVEIWQDQTV